MLIAAFGCTKEENTNTDLFIKIVGNYSGKADFTRNEEGVLTSGTENNLNLSITFTNNKYTISYVFPEGNTIMEFNNLVLNSNKIYFEIPNQLNEEGNSVKGNKCYNLNSTFYDGYFDINTNKLFLCTRFGLTGLNFGTTVETYTKN